MEINPNDNESLTARIQQLEHERDELRKDIEQLCMQQAGPSYLVIATRMHFQRTASLEQEIELLKKKLAACARDNLNLQEELSETYRVKSQLADLHGAEVTKNTEAEKQVKFFQGCVASAFAERDHSIMEAEKAKEKEELMSQKFNEFKERLEGLTLDNLQQKKLNDKLQIDLANQEELNETFKRVIDKFYGIRHNFLEGYESMSWDNKCASLLHDPADSWSFYETPTSKYIIALKEELETLKISVDSLQNKLRVGLEIENHLKKKVRELEKKKILSDKLILSRIAELRHYHSQHRVDILNLLNEGKFHIKSIVDAVEEKNSHIDVSSGQTLGPLQRDVKSDEFECRDVHISIGVDPNSRLKRKDPSFSDILDDRKGDDSEALSQALQEKVAALLLLSQQEERHLLERNVNAVLQQKIEELQRNLLQVTNEKVKALMEFAQLKQEYQLLLESNNSSKNLTYDRGEKRHLPNERDGRLKHLLKKTYLKRWIGAQDLSGNEAEAHLNNEVNFPSRRSSSMNFARMKIENAALKEGMESMEHLTSSVHRLHLSLLKVKESRTCDCSYSSMLEALDDIISEAKLVKTALGSSLPISWSAEADSETIAESMRNESRDYYRDWSTEKIDSVSAAGFEMVDLLILAAQILKENTTRAGS
ncbi:hypothetical protein CFOL_v3_18426 [Cephalotus follicularis]|uniref:Uncharacterized protein n=1 Tax=Cephalotus follicularis TaxID=3775 RepID=A0A1Q3C3W1_CEPFO|nr:hypothetical protein CFOL_v3_18426 [Cephalotus follicularis]